MGPILRTAQYTSMRVGIQADITGGRKGMNPPGKPLKTQSALTIILTPKVTHPIPLHGSTRMSPERILNGETGVRKYSSLIRCTPAAFAAGAPA